MLLCEPHSCYNFIDRDSLAQNATVTLALMRDGTIIATVTHVFITRGTHYAMKTHSLMPDRTHNITAVSPGISFDNPCVLQHFLATGVPSFIPDDTIIATMTPVLMPEITCNATVALCFLPDYNSSHCAVLGVIFTDGCWITLTFALEALVFFPQVISKTNLKSRMITSSKLSYSCLSSPAENS